MTEKELEIQLALGSLSDDMKIKLADDSNTSTEVLTKLSKDKDKDWFIRYCVTENPNTPKEVLKKLSKDEDVSVRYYATEKPNFDSKVKYDD